MTLKKFPRGGKKVIIGFPNTFPRKYKKVKRKQKHGNIIRKYTSEKHEPLISNTVPNLRFSTLCKGMLILGRLFKVTDYYAIVSLPGHISGKIQATEVSKSYTNLLKKVTNNEKISNEFQPLSNLYKEGDYVVTCIKELYPDSKQISLSLEPYLVNQNLNPSFLTKYSKVYSSIHSHEDHGYILETGLKNFRAFLSMKDIENKEIILYPGKQILCAIKDIKLTESMFTAKVSTTLNLLKKIETDIQSIDNLIPGMQIALTVNKILSNGLQVYFGKDNTGYVNQIFLQNCLSSYKEGDKITGTLLYTEPVTKLSYFYLLEKKKEDKKLVIGDIIIDAKILSLDTSGILLLLTKNIHGYIPFKRTEVDIKKIDLSFSINSTHKCKIIAYDLMSKLYICSMEKKLLEKQFISSNDLQVGNVIEVTIISINQKTGYVSVSVGDISGIVPPDQVLDPGLINELKCGQKTKARILESTKKNVFTLKKSLIESKLPILSEIKTAKVNSVHDGTVIKISNDGVLVRFFNNVKGWIPKSFLGSETSSHQWNLILGQTITTVIKKVYIEECKILLALSDSKISKTIKYNIGDIVEGYVTDSSKDGVYLQLENDNEKITAFLPASHISPCLEVGNLLAAKTNLGDLISAVVFSKNPNLILCTIFTPEKIYKIENLNPGDLVICSVVKIYKNHIKVLLPISNMSKFGTILVNNFENLESIYKFQMLYGKIIKIDKKTQNVQLVIHFNDIWNSIKQHEVKMMAAIDILSIHLNKLNELAKKFYYTNKPISKIRVGQKIKGLVESSMDCGLILKLEENVKGLVRNDHISKNYKQGDEIEGLVLWVNLPQEYVEITLLNKFMNMINEKQNEVENILVGIQYRGEIVLTTDWFILVVLKGRGKGALVTLPVRRNLNDTLPDISPYQIGNKIRCYGVLNKNDVDILLSICMLKSAFELRNSKINESIDIPLKLKRKSRETIGEIDSMNKKLKNDTEYILKKKKKKKLNKKNFPEIVKIITERKEENLILNTKKSIERKINATKKIANSLLPKQDNKSTISLSIPECGFKWNSSVRLKSTEYISSDSDDLEEFINTKKKKFSQAEKREFERQKERKIREREETMMSSQTARTVDQFDKLVLSSPDNSLVWIQYISHHLQATELEKARTIVKRALKTINFREENENLNIWLTWLNLESKFGTLGLLNEVFQEAVQKNDAEKIYSHMLKVHTDTKRIFELEKVINTMITKFKNNIETWINCGTALFEIGFKEKARKIFQKALQSLPATKHVDLIVKFAHLENKLGDEQRSQTLFEYVLTSYPKRIDIWSVYVDSLVKSNQVQLARKVLDQAITLTLPVKKMKSIFKKYLKFEEKHGTTENISRIKELAVKYVNK